MLCNLTDSDKSQPGVFVIRSDHAAQVYIGASKHLGRAFLTTRRELRRGFHGSRQLQAHATAHGLAALRFEVLATCPPAELTATKQRYLDQLHATDPAHGFNVLPAAGLAPGQPLSPEHRARISAGKAGRPISKRTPEHQEKLAAAHRGRKRSPETCAAISAATTGKKKHRKSPPAA